MLANLQAPWDDSSPTNAIMRSYMAVDEATSPPTHVWFVDEMNFHTPEMLNSDETIFAVSVSAVEPTEGWLHREGKPSLTICFMHSFGKCAGRTGGDPSSCYQIHIDRQVLNALRRHYHHPPRRYFARTVKVQLLPELHRQLSLYARKELKVQYLEYKVHDVAPSKCLSLYEAAYRRWLFDDTKSTESFSDSSVYQCTLFACTGDCPDGAACRYIHANLDDAFHRDYSARHEADEK